MKKLFSVVLRDKQIEKYNIFASLEGVKRMLRNLCVFVDGIDVCLRNVENYVPCESKGGDLGNPLAQVHVRWQMYPRQMETIKGG